MLTWRALSSRLGKQSLALDLHQPGTHRPRGWPADDGAGGYGKLAAVAVARHRRAVQLAHRERAPGVGSGIIEAVQTSVRIRYADLGSRDIEHAHLPRRDLPPVTSSSSPGLP